MNSKEDEVQQKIKQYLEKKKTGLNFNENLKKQKEFSNPKILENIIQHFEIEQYGSNYSKEVYNPLAINREDFYDKLAEDSKKPFSKIIEMK
eukprot:gene3497-6145_t